MVESTKRTILRFVFGAGGLGACAAITTLLQLYTAAEAARDAIQKAAFEKAQLAGELQEAAFAKALMCGELQTALTSALEIAKACVQ